MSLDCILLGLCRTSSSGYDLKTVFDVAITYFWPAELSQIYPALRQLERQGLLKSRVVPSARGPNRRLYQTTAPGRAALRKWLEDGPAFRDERYAFAAQIFLLDALGSVDGSAAFVRRLRAVFEARHRALAAVEQDAGSDVGLLEADEFHHYLSLRLGLRVLEARIAWCDEALGHLRRRRKAQARKRAGGRRT